MAETGEMKSPADINDEEETIDVGTTSLPNVIAHDTIMVDENIDSSGSSEESISRDMAVTQSVPVDSIDGDGDISIQSKRTSSPKSIQCRRSPPPNEDVVSSPTEAGSSNLSDTYLSRKVFSCTLCDYSTNERSSFKRHKRLHVRSNPVNVLKCEKCVFTTILPRKIREHYRQQHNMAITSRQSDCYESPSPAYSNQQSQENTTAYHNLEISSRQSSQEMPLAPRALHSLLTTVGPGRLGYAGRIQNPTIQGYEAFETQPLQRVQDPHMATNYLRSIVSTVLPPNPLHRVAATSTITSSSYYLNSGGINRHLPTTTLQNPSLASMQAMDLQVEPGVKVKQEPLDMVMDTVSSSGVSTRSPEPVRQFETCSNQRQRIVYPQPDSMSVLTDRNSTTIPTEDINQPGVSGESRRDCRRESRYYDFTIEPSGSQANIKSEMSSIGVQCALPVVKTETTDWSENNKRRVRGTLLMIERGTQCELIQSSVNTNQSSNQGYTSDSESNDNHTIPVGRNGSKCLHCGVSFDDEVIYSIHIGCHSHTDPYTCNVCGKQCHNKYAFYSHIMRGHQC